MRDVMWEAQVMFLKSEEEEGVEIDWVKQYKDFHPNLELDAGDFHCIENHPDHCPDGDCETCPLNPYPDMGIVIYIISIKC